MPMPNLSVSTECDFAGGWLEHLSAVKEHGYPSDRNNVIRSYA